MSDAPSGTPVDVQATYRVDGHVAGTGVYGYSSIPRDDRGAPARAGIYLVRARGEGFESTRRLLRVR